MKVTGEMWNKFYNDEGYWAGYYHDDTLILQDGVEIEEYDTVKESSVITIECGSVFEDAYSKRESVDLVKFYRKWLKTQTEVGIVVTVKKENVKEIAKEIRKIAGVVKVQE
ncbi:hypothetical protein [Salmonella phage SSBI34]|nr:hypothetical protein [Salmonella phage SSBI34]